MNTLTAACLGVWFVLLALFIWHLYTGRDNDQ